MAPDQVLFSRWRGDLFHRICGLCHRTGGAELSRSWLATSLSFGSAPCNDRANEQRCRENVKSEACFSHKHIHTQTQTRRCTADADSMDKFDLFLGQYWGRNLSVISRSSEYFVIHRHAVPLSTERTPSKLRVTGNNQL